MRCKTNSSRAANALFISFFGLCLLHAPANKQDFHHKNDLFLPKTGENARCKRGVNCVREGQKCLILQGKPAFVRGLPWQTNSIFIILEKPQKSPKNSRFPANSSLRFVASGGTSWHGKVQKRCKIRCKTIAFSLLYTITTVFSTINNRRSATCGTPIVFLPFAALSPRTAPWTDSGRRCRAGGRRRFCPCSPGVWPLRSQREAQRRRRCRPARPRCGRCGVRRQRRPHF